MTEVDLPLVSRARTHGGRTAIVDAAGAHACAELLDASARVASALLGEADDLAGIQDA